MDSSLGTPVIVDLGKTKRKNIKRLRQGRGKLVGDVEEAMREVSMSMGDQSNGKELVPVVLVYRKKSKRRRRGGFLPFF